MAEKSPLKVITGKVRLSYVHVFEPYSKDPEKRAPKYSCMVLIPKNDTKTLDDLKAAIEAAKAQGKSTKWNGKIPHNLKVTLRDCDEEWDLDETPEFAGHMFLNVSAQRKPGIVDRQNNFITDTTEVYSGCYARVELGAFPFNGESNGVSFGLNHIQKIADGDRLDNVTSAQDVFEPLDEDAADDLI